MNVEWVSMGVGKKTAKKRTKHGSPNGHKQKGSQKSVNMIFIAKWLSLSSEKTFRLSVFESPVQQQYISN